MDPTAHATSATAQCSLRFSYNKAPKTHPTHLAQSSSVVFPRNPHMSDPANGMSHMLLASRLHTFCCNPPQANSTLQTPLHSAACSAQITHVKCYITKRQRQTKPTSRKALPLCFPGSHICPTQPTACPTCCWPTGCAQTAAGQPMSHCCHRTNAQQTCQSQGKWTCMRKQSGDGR
jgi:hypothetical protein